MFALFQARVETSIDQQVAAQLQMLAQKRAEAVQAAILAQSKQRSSVSEKEVATQLAEFAGMQHRTSGEAASVTNSVTTGTSAMTKASPGAASTPGMPPRVPVSRDNMYGLYERAVVESYENAPASANSSNKATGPAKQVSLPKQTAHAQMYEPGNTPPYLGCEDPISVPQPNTTAPTTSHMDTSTTRVPSIKETFSSVLQAVVAGGGHTSQTALPSAISHLNPPLVQPPPVVTSGSRDITRDSVADHTTQAAVQDSTAPPIPSHTAVTIHSSSSRLPSFASVLSGQVEANPVSGQGKLPPFGVGVPGQVTTSRHVTTSGHVSLPDHAAAPGHLTTQGHLTSVSVLEASAVPTVAGSGSVPRTLGENNISKLADYKHIPSSQNESAAIPSTVIHVSLPERANVNESNTVTAGSAVSAPRQVSDKQVPLNTADIQKWPATSEPGTSEPTVEPSISEPAMVPTTPEPAVAPATSEVVMAPATSEPTVSQLDPTISQPETTPDLTPSASDIATTEPERAILQEATSQSGTEERSPTPDDEEFTVHITPIIPNRTESEPSSPATSPSVVITSDLMEPSSEQSKMSVELIPQEKRDHMRPTEAAITSSGSTGHESEISDMSDRASISPGLNVPTPESAQLTPEHVSQPNEN